MGITTVGGREGEMSLLNAIPIIGRLFDTADKAIELAKEHVVDKDKQNELIAHLEEIKTGASYIEELRTKTVPWIDGLHKMGRQIINLIVILAWLISLWIGHDLTQWDVFILGGGNVAYQLIKGKGK